MVRKIILTLCITYFSLSSFCQVLSKQQLRANYLQATQRKSALDSFNTMLTNIASPSPVEQSYCGITTAMQIRYTDGTWGKYRLVVKSKDLLNAAIARDNKDPELRLMRFMLEHHLPSFLCMSTHLNEDLQAIFAQENFLDGNIELKKMVAEFLLGTKRCNENQVRILERALNDVKRATLAQAKL
jgi:hypothetical protein